MMTTVQQTILASASKPIYGSVATSAVGQQSLDYGDPRYGPSLKSSTITR